MTKPKTHSGEVVGVGLLKESMTLTQREDGRWFLELALPDEVAADVEQADLDTFGVSLCYVRDGQAHLFSVAGDTLEEVDQHEDRLSRTLRATELARAHTVGGKPS